MSGHEARINDALRQLGDEYRLGMVQVAEYRSRRKLLVDSWGERDVTTSPRSLKGKTATATGPAPAGRKATPASAPARKNPAPLVVAGLATLVLAGGAWFMWGSAGKPVAQPAPMHPGVAPLSTQALAVRKAADEFVARNVWDAASIEAFLTQWQALGPADRVRVAAEPAMRTLQYRLEQNIQAEMQLITPETKPEDRAQLTLLQDFSRALAGTSQ